MRLTVVAQSRHPAGPGGRTARGSWLGKNSSQGKMYRLLREIHLHMSLRVSGDQSQVRESYVAAVLDAVLRPLRTRGVEGVDDAIRRLDDYDLTREDVDTLVELVGEMRGKGAADLWADIPTQVKTQFTRKYNAGTHSLPYSLVKIAVSRGSAGALEAGADPDAEEEPEVEAEAEGDDDDDAAAKGDNVRVRVGASDRRVPGV